MWETHKINPVYYHQWLVDSILTCYVHGTTTLTIKYVYIIYIYYIYIRMQYYITTNDQTKIHWDKLTNHQI